MKERKTVVGKFLQKISKSVPAVLDIAGDITGIDMLDKAAALISGDTSIGTKDKEVLLKQIEVAKEMETARLADVDSARKMQMTALTQSDTFSKRFTYYLASFWSILAGVFICSVLYIDVPVNNIRLIDTILGFLLGTVISGIIGYFFGSSSGSDKKTDLINEIKNKIK